MPSPFGLCSVITLIPRYHEVKHPGPGWTAENWFYGFASRHKDKVGKRTIEAISTARTDPLTKEEISTWVTKFEDWMVAGGYSWPNLINVYEMLVKLGNNSSASKAIVSTSIARPGEVPGLRGQFAIFIPFVTASEEFWFCQLDLEI
ncbi:hypothetical protein HDU99_007765 [Rhizoclosmatium hyalinum]|nr:hypothetical protein HDU99_007765 [Rhizoclosmatium hyalinum]